jgi:hypothetical protein
MFATITIISRNAPTAIFVSAPPPRMYRASSSTGA